MSQCGQNVDPRCSALPEASRGTDVSAMNSSAESNPDPVVTATHTVSSAATVGSTKAPLALSAGALQPSPAAPQCTIAPATSTCQKLPAPHKQQQLQLVPPLVGTAAPPIRPAPSNHQQNFRAAPKAPSQTVSSNNGNTLRKGKWTREEEMYADCLITEFEKGILEDCDNGSTLRMYLSRKLHCAPMRVSKKYAGQGIGKHVYLADRGFVASPADRMRRNELETAFYKSLLGQVETPGGYPVTFAGSVFPGLEHSVPNHTIMYGAPMQLAPGTLIPLIPPQSFVSAVAPPSQLPPSSDQAKRMQQMYPSSLEGIKSSYSKADSASDASKPSTANGVPVQPYLAPTNGQYAPLASAPTEKAVLPAGASLTHVPQTVPLPSPSENSLEVPDFLFGFEKVAATRAMQASSLPGSGMEKPKHPPLVSLFGADGVHHPPSPSLASAHLTPTFTSRSFDDFHRLLGNDCSPGGAPFDLNATSKDGADMFVKHGKASIPSAEATHAIPGIQGVTTGVPKYALNGGSAAAADFYAVFAQQSAKAVSQHSAYHQAGAPTVGVGISGTSATVAPLLAPRPPNVPPPSVANALNLKAIAKASGRKPTSQVSDSSSDGTSEKAPVPDIRLNTITQTYQPPSGNFVSVSDGSSEVGTEETESAQASSRGSGSDSNTSTASDNASDNVSNDSDSVSDEGPSQKKAKIAHLTISEGEQMLEMNTLSDRMTPGGQ